MLQLQDQITFLQAFGWDPNVVLPNTVDDILREGARFNSHPGSQFWLTLAPYSSLLSYQTATANHMLSRSLTMMLCEEVFQGLQDEYAAMQKAIIMMSVRQATDSHAEHLLRHVQSMVSDGQGWFQQHHTTRSLFDILFGRQQPYSFSRSAVSAIEEVCKEIVQGRCDCLVWSKIPVLTSLTHMLKLTFTVVNSLICVCRCGGPGGTAFDDSHLVLAGQGITEVCDGSSETDRQRKHI